MIARPVLACLVAGVLATGAAATTDPVKRPSSAHALSNAEGHALSNAEGHALSKAEGSAGAGGETPETLTETERRERLQRHRNLGKALYENPATQYDAVPEFEAALALAPDSTRDRVNLGLALLRAGRTEEGIAQLERAQEQDPSIPHTWFNLGIAYKNASEYAKAIEQLQGMLERVPDEPVTHYNLGVLHKLQGDGERSVDHFERAAELDPNLAGPWFQLAAAYRQADRTEDAARAMERFRELKTRDRGAAVPEDLEWSWYAEIYDPVDPEPRPAPEVEVVFAVEELAGGFGAAGSETGRETVAEASDPGRKQAGGLLILQADGDPDPDLLGWSAEGLRLFPDGGPPADGEDAGLGQLHAPAAQRKAAGADAPAVEGPGAEAGAPGTADSASIRHVAAGDLDDDGLHDLAVVTDRGVVLLANRGGRFEAVAGLPEEAARPFDRALWVDFDHDYDLDLLLLGPEPALIRNDGQGSDGVAWSDRSDDFPIEALAGGGRVTAAVRFDLVADTQGIDVAVAQEGREDGAGGVLFRDRLGDRYEAAHLPELPAGTVELLAGDLDHDGWTDLVAGTEDGVTVLRNGHRYEDHLGFEAVEIAGGPGAPLAVLDLSNRGASDLVAGGRFLRDLGSLRFEAAAGPEALGDATAVAAADFDADGRTDLAALAARAGGRADGSTDGEAGGAGSGDRAVLLLTNRTETDHGWLRVALAGVKNPKLAAGAEVEVKAGSLYQKKLYDGVPLVFGLAGHEAAEAVRITWPNGLIQNETRQAAGTSATYEEAQRLSGSCPMVFTWNGEEFEFITDVLGVAPLGASAGEGEYFAADHDEVIQIPGESLAETRDGRYEVRLTEELREVGYLDRIRLLAVDHPAGIDVFTNDKFKGPPFPEFLLFGVEEARHRYPVGARDHRGRDVRERLLARDATYPDGFERDDSGLAELHHLELDFGPERGPARLAGEGRRGRDVLVLSGWVDWADGSTFLASSQNDGPGLVLPYLQVKDESGEWVTVIEDMGIPAGKPKTIVVDLTGKWLSASREVRIVTSACVYWDEIFLAEETLVCRPAGFDSGAGSVAASGPASGAAASLSLGAGADPGPPRVPASGAPMAGPGGPAARPSLIACSPDEHMHPGVGAPPLRLAEVPAAEADLRFRGFSRPVIHPERLQPEVFVYADWSPTAMWDQAPGLYTRYGDVAELLAEVDDRFVVFGSGDELRLSYDAGTLPPVPDGWRRDFLLWVDGWAKDGDANTAHSQTVEPLPYHGMPGYPYEAPHAYPDDPEHRRYLEEYLTRPALRLIRPLTEGTPADPRRGRTAAGAGERDGTGEATEAGPAAPGER